MTDNFQLFQELKGIAKIKPLKSIISMKIYITGQEKYGKFGEQQTKPPLTYPLKQTRNKPAAVK